MECSLLLLAKHRLIKESLISLATASCYICPVPVNCRNMMTWSRELEVVVVKPASSVFDCNDMRACSYSNEHIDVNAGPLLCFCSCADPSQQVPKFRVKAGFHSGK